tara:strand:+ start:444 stop:1127 length:684 start_codon:yes stop_codon:yes gene_type:complete
MNSINFILLSLFLLLASSLNLFSKEKLKRIVEYKNPKVAWDVENKFIMPECFEYEWLSGDNYEEFYDTYIGRDKILQLNNYYNKFAKNVGKYLNKQVPLNHEIKKSSWGRTGRIISLTKNLKDCLEDEPVTRVRYRTKQGYTREFIDYKITRTLDVSAAKYLAPHIEEKFHSIREIEITSWAGGSRGYDIYVLTYGVLKLDGQILLLPLNRIEFRTPKYEKYKRKAL